VEVLGTTTLSDDGRWAAVPITRVDRTAGLDVYAIVLSGAGATPAAGAPPTPFFVAREGSAPAFSADSTWVAYRIGVSEAEREKLQDEKKPIRDGMGLLRLDPAAAKPEPVIVQDVTRWAFAPAAPTLPSSVFRPKAPAQGRRPPGPEPATGAMTALTSRSSQDNGRLLAFTIDADRGDGNGVRLIRRPDCPVDPGEATFVGSRGGRRTTTCVLPVA
jgi:hypothetical protein